MFTQFAIRFIHRRPRCGNWCMITKRLFWRNQSTKEPRLLSWATILVDYWTVMKTVMNNCSLNVMMNRPTTCLHPFEAFARYFLIQPKVRLQTTTSDLKSSVLSTRPTLHVHRPTSISGHCRVVSYTSTK